MNYKEKLSIQNINNYKLYDQAFLHKSAVTEENPISNERLEFIGDSVLGLVVAQHLYEKYPQENEGFLTKIRTKIVSGKSLSKIAKKLNFEQFIKMNEKGLRNEWNKNPRLLEDCLEAIIGAIYLDQGLDSSMEFIKTNIIETFNDEFLLEDTNYKDILMRFLQSRKSPNLPEYKMYKDNYTVNKLFIIHIYINGKFISEGMHKNKKEAEQRAAKRSLQCFNII